MQPPTPSRPRRIRRNAWFALVMILVVAATAYESTAHGHAPLAAGWHDADPHGNSGHDDGRTPCSICVVAHSTSADLHICVDGVHSQRFVVQSVPDVDACTLSVNSREHSPRAPPCLAFC